jgi:two-component system phosphate regulon response regulator PhoB
MNPRILLAEDDQNIQIIVRDCLEPHGFEVRFANNGEEALQMLSQNVPDLLILDIAMPVLDGLDVARRIRQKPETARLPILALTALVLPDDAVRAYSAGCDSFMIKPFTPAQLLADVQKLLHLPERTR